MYRVWLSTPIRILSDNSDSGVLPHFDSNERTDEYSCSPNNALRLLHRVVLGIRAAVPSNFILGLKINAADYADSDVTAEASLALNHVRTIAHWELVDFIEISGGDYENPGKSGDYFLTHPTPPSARQALFAAFALQALGAVEALPHAPRILLTGGLTTPAHLHTALAARHAHLLGIGRSAVLCPDLPERLKLNQTPSDSSAAFAPPPDLRVGGDSAAASGWILTRLPRIKLLGAGVAMAWYVVALRRLTNPGLKTPRPPPDYAVGGLGAILWMWAWFGPERSLLLAGPGQFYIATCMVLVAMFVSLWIGLGM